MRPRSLSLSFVLALVLLAPRAFSQSSQTATGSGGAARPAPATSAQKSGARPARGPLPDPALLDGSTQAPEKKSEYGMLGEFEIPGDENSKSGKVGGPQRPPGQSGGGSKSEPGLSISIPGLPPLGLPSGGAGAGGSPGLPSLSLPDPTKSGASSAAGGSGAPLGAEPKGSGSAAGAPGAGNDASAGGIQVAELKTDESAGGAGSGPNANVQKPQPVAIGDPTMQIKPAANAPGVVGAQTTAGATQQMEKTTGGGKGGGSGDGNRGVEKGRVMPAGL